MDEKRGEKSRRERRKEARLAKNKKKFNSWVQHKQSWNSKTSMLESNPETWPTLVLNDESKNCIEQPQKEEKLERTRILGAIMDVSSEDCGEQLSPMVNSKIQGRNLKRKKGLRKCSKTNFDQYLEMEMGVQSVSAEKDLKLEDKLAKKLKVKNGRLSAVNDDIDALLEGIPSVLNSFTGEEIANNFASGALVGNSVESNSDTGELNHEISDDQWNDDSDSNENEEHDFLSEEEILKKITKIGKRKKLKLEKYRDADIQLCRNSDEADLALERKLSKKLRVKKGNLGEDDDINLLLEESPSSSDSLMNDQMQNPEKHPVKNKKMKISKLIEKEHKKGTEIDSDIGAYEHVEASPANALLKKIPGKAQSKYVAPHLRSRGENDSEEYDQLRKRVRGLLNRLSENNVESITSEISALFHSVSQSTCSLIISEEVVASCSGGPRGNEQYAAVFAAFVAGMACLVGVEFGAKLLSCLAKCFEEEYTKEDNLSLRNLTLLLSYLYVFGVCSSELLYDFLVILSKRLTEVDVSTVLTVLQCCGMNLRGDNPTEMKFFIASIQSRVNELKSSSEKEQSSRSSKRMEFMLETICDIKNNKKKTKGDTLQHSRIKKWLQKLKVDDILIRGLKWSKLLDHNQKGQWWLSEDIMHATDNVEEVAGTIDKEIPETIKMLQLAASQRMNTDARRAIFCVIMSGEDYIDAFEKLLRLDLPGKQDREIIRVLVECCLQEKIFNKYYCLLASKLCSFDKNHKFTLQYCLWDHFKELDSMPLIRSTNLSKFVAELVGSFSISLAVLKAAELDDAMQLTEKKIMHFRGLFEAIFEFPDKLVWNIFTRIAITPDYESLRNAIEFFISKYVVDNHNFFAKKLKMARKALHNIEGILM